LDLKNTKTTILIFKQRSNHVINPALTMCNYKFFLILGLCTDGVYKVPGVKSKVQSLKIQYNRRQSVNLADYDLAVVTSLLKQYLRYCVLILVYFVKI